MDLLILFVAAAAAAYILLWLACIRTVFDASRFPPRVPSLLAGYDNGLLYVLNPCAFLSRCQ